MRRLRGISSARLAALLAGSLLVGCAEEGAGPQFASDPRPTRSRTEATGQATPALLPTTEAALSPVVEATPASLPDLLAVRGAVPRVFIALGDAVWSIASNGNADRLFDAPEGSSILAIDASPSAQQVAILLQASADGLPKSEVIVLDASGELLTRVAEVEGIAATPVAATVAGTQTIDWSPQGDRVLVSLPNGKIADLVVGEDIAPGALDVVAELGSTIDPRWSPTGETIAFISESSDGRSRSLMILDRSDGAISEVVTPGEGRLVVDFAWMPDGVSLLFTEGGEPGRAATGIDLWRVDADGQNRQLVVSAGTVAPVARIANLSPSPDGRSVAYSVLVPGPSGPLVDSVWVREYESGVGFRIPLPSVSSVEDIWWTDEGLILSVVTSGTPQSRQPTQALLQLRKDGSIAALWAAPVAVGTPMSGTPSAAATGR
jgi:dipeptidyl aminopeptidase/acylaminoacyl peptidase